MKIHDFQLSRRRLVTGLGTAAAVIAWPQCAAVSQILGQSRPKLSLRLEPGTARLRDGWPTSVIWGFATESQETRQKTRQEPHLEALQYTQGDDLQIDLTNGLPIPVTLTWRSIAGMPQLEPLIARPALQPGQMFAVNVPLRQAGTVLCDAHLLGDGQTHALPAKAISVLEKQPVEADRDQTLLIEDWRLRPDGSTASPGRDADAGTPTFTINGTTALDIPARSHERLRLRFINACQRSVVVIKVDDHDLRVMAIDGQPAEPFLARNGQVVLAPGTRIDVFIDAAGRPSNVSTIHLHDGTSPRPIARLVYTSDDPVRNAPLATPTALPPNGLPAKLDLQNATRTDLVLDIKPNATDWLAPTSMNETAAAPAFRIKRGRVAVLTLSNRAATPVVFHLHGHHFRLLDQLDDGWKPFWLDTLIVDAQQTQRIAFAADNAGAWLIEAMGTVWEAPRLVRWYAVE